MKNLGKFMMGAFALSVVFTSCTKDNVAPTISGAGLSATTANPGDTIVVTATLSDSEGELSSVELTQVYNGGSSTTVTTESVSGGSTSFTYNYVVSSTASAGDTYTLTLALTDGHKDPLTVEETLSVITVADPNSPINSYTAKLVGAQSNTTTGSYFASTTGTVYLQAEANTNSSLVDFIYYYGSTNLATLASPADVTVNGGSGNLDLAVGFSTKNDTQFKTSTVTAAEFDAMTDDATISTLTGFNDSKANSLATGNVIAFKTAAGKLGLIKIGTINDGAAGDMTIDVKVQQ